MKQTFWIALLFAALILACGCTQQGAAPPTTTPTPTLTATPTATVTPAGSLPVELSSSSPNATLSLDAGVLFVSFHAAEAQEMAIDFANISQGFDESNEFSVTGPYDGSLVFEIPQKDEYLLNISGTGAWTAKASQYAPGEGLKAPLNLTGNGTEVPPAMYLEKGDYIFERNETGEASPLYLLRHANGSFVMDTNNSRVEPGFPMLSNKTFGFFTVPESGTYILSVIAQKNPSTWKASILPATALPAFGPGPEIPENESTSV